MNKQEIIRARIIEKYGDRINVNFNIEYPKLRRRTGFNEIEEILKEIVNFKIGENVKVEFQSWGVAREFCIKVRYWMKKYKIIGIRASLRQNDVWIIKEASVTKDETKTS